MTRSYIEKVLRLNGISASEAQEEIENFFKKMNWSDDNIKYALVLIKETEISSVDEGGSITPTQAEIKRSAERIENVKNISGDYNADKIRSLLNIELDASIYEAADSINNRHSASLNQILLMTLYIVLFSIVTFGVTCWYYDIDVLAHV